MEPRAPAKPRYLAILITFSATLAASGCGDGGEPEGPGFEYHPEENPALVQLRAQDSIPEAGELVDIAVADTPYTAPTGDSLGLRLNATRDTLLFTYRTLHDSVYSNTVSTDGGRFALRKGPDGSYLLAGRVAVEYSDAVQLGPAWDHSLAVRITFGRPLPAGTYGVQVKVEQICYCAPRSSTQAYGGAFTLR